MHKCYATTSVKKKEDKLVLYYNSKSRAGTKLSDMIKNL